MRSLPPQEVQALEQKIRFRLRRQKERPRKLR